MPGGPMQARSTREIVRDAAIGVAVADTPGACRRCATRAARRRSGDGRPMPAFQAWIDAIPPDHLPNGRVILRSEAVRDGADRLCAIAGTPEGEDRDRLRDDVAALADIFAGVMDARHLRLRLSPVDTDGCRRFHVDAIHAAAGLHLSRGRARNTAVSTTAPPIPPASSRSRPARRSCCAARSGRASRRV